MSSLSKAFFIAALVIAILYVSSCEPERLIAMLLGAGVALQSASFIYSRWQRGRCK